MVLKPTWFVWFSNYYYRFICFLLFPWFVGWFSWFLLHHYLRKIRYTMYHLPSLMLSTKKEISSSPPLDPRREEKRRQSLMLCLISKQELSYIKYDVRWHLHQTRDTTHAVQWASFLILPLAKNSYLLPPLSTLCFLCFARFPVT